jgi:flagellar biosynthesis GTPase FlhF
MKRFLTATALALALCAPIAAHAADYGVGDLRRMHSEYDANEARWANTFTGRTFEGVMPLGKVKQEVFGGGYYATFFEDPTDWMPGVYCDKMPTSQFLIQRNKGELIEISGVIDRHAFGAVHLTNCALSLAPTPAEIEAAKARRAEAEARAQHDAAEAEAKAKAKAAAEAEAQAKAEADRPRVEAEAKAKIEAEQAQIEADAKAKVRAQIEADLRAKAVAEAQAKADADAAPDIEAATHAKDEAVAKAKAAEDTRLAAEAKARLADNIRDAKAKADAVVRLKAANLNKLKAQFETFDDNNLITMCNNLRLYGTSVPSEDAVLQGRLSCEVLKERGVRG